MARNPSSPCRRTRPDGTSSSAQWSRAVTKVDNPNDRDIHVTDNGDGTLTVIYLAAGTNTVYDDEGNVIAHAAGSVTVEAVWDHAGTVTDRSDDEPISFTFLRSSGSETSTSAGCSCPRSPKAAIAS